MKLTHRFSNFTLMKSRTNASATMTQKTRKTKPPISA